MKFFEAKNLKAVTREGKEILSGVDFSIEKNETAVLLGPNGAGKSTVAGAIMGDPKFEATGEVKFRGKNLLKLPVDERAKLGIFCSFQNPIEIPGISTTEMIRGIFEEKKGGFVPIDNVREKITEAARQLDLNIWFSERELNVGLSGGEKKKNEIMQMLTLKPKLVILDEIDSGLDVDAGKKISKVLRKYQEESGCSYLIITHNMRVLGSLEPTRAVLIDQGRVRAVGDKKLIRAIETKGFKTVLEKLEKEGEK